MPLLPTQLQTLYEAIDASPFHRYQFVFEATVNNTPIVRFKEFPNEMFFSMGGTTHRDLDFAPGETNDRQREPAPHFDADVMHWFKRWLGFVNRQLKALERLEGGDSPAPDWALKHLPDEYRQVAAEIIRLDEIRRRLERMAGLFYETGEPLNRLVRDALKEIGISAELTAAGATYDVIATLTAGRLLIEVTGIDGYIAKGSKKIAQVLQAHDDARAGDRVVLAINAYRQEPLPARTSRELMTADALKLLVGLDCVVISTTDLFELWTRARSDRAAAIALVASIRTCPPGIFQLLE